MKRILALILFAALCMGCLCIGISATSEDYTADTWSNAELKGLFYQDTDFITSDLAPDYEAWWWEDEVEELDDYSLAAYVNMRGFAMSADGKYAYMGTLNGGDGVRGVVVLDTSVGRVTDLYYHYDGDQGLAGSPFSYAKGIDADDRGYVYTGFAFSLNYNLLNLGIAKQQDDGTLEEVYFGAVYDNGETPGDSAGVKIGVNGVEVAKIGDKYFCYVMSNYDHDVLYCYDVTDPANPVLNTGFGIGGMIDFNDADCSINLGGKHLDEGQYMAVDDNGILWLCASLKEGGTGIIKIDASGITCLAFTEQSDAYCIAHEGNFLLVGLKDGSAVNVLDDSTFETVAAIEVPDADRVTRILVINDTLYVCGAGSDGLSYNYIYAAPLTADAQTALDAQVAAINTFKQSEAGDEETTEAPTQAPSDQETEPATQPPADDTAEQPTQAPGNEEVTTQPEQSSGSCGGIIGAGAMVAMLWLGACVVTKKNKD